jgi:hypothetical protein
MHGDLYLLLMHLILDWYSGAMQSVGSKNEQRDHSTLARSPQCSWLDSSGADSWRWGSKVLHCKPSLPMFFSHWVVIFFQLVNLPLRECFVWTRMYSNSFFENAIWPITVVGFLCLLLVSDFVFFHACGYATVILSDLNIEFRCGLWLTAVGSKKVMGVVIDGCSKVPDEFVLQHISNANPPTLFMVLDSKSQICPFQPLL